MRIITDAPIEIKSGCCGQYSNADNASSDGGETGRNSKNIGKQGYFSKSKRTQRKIVRQEKRAARRAKRGSRPLK